MKTVFGEIRQIGFVSRDIDASIRYFLDAWNIGPWYVSRHIKAAVGYKGEVSDVDMSLALSSCADMQFEIIAQHNDAPSVYREALAATSGLHVQHLAVWVDDIAKVKADAVAKGWQFVLEGRPGPGESCYVTHPSSPGVCVEISDRSSFKEHVRATIRDIALSWDGTDPIREGLPGLVPS